MKSLVFAGVIMSAVLASATVKADTECEAPVKTWQSRDVLRAQLEQQGLQVQRIKIDDDCYEVRGIDADGNRFKAKYAPDTLKILKMEIKYGRHGEGKHGQNKASQAK